MFKARLAWLAVAGLALLILVSLSAALAAANTVHLSRVDIDSLGITITQFTPSECASLGAGNLVSCSGLCVGSGGGDLLLGSSGTDWILAAGGNDCVVGGAGTDILLGGAGTDVCIGNSGTSFVGCETEIVR